MRLFIFLFVAASALALPAAARPTGPRGLCTTYPDAAHCAGRTPSCAECHSSPPALNLFGTAVATALYDDGAYTFDDVSFESRLPIHLAALESEDADLDGTSNLEEFMLGTFAGDARSFPDVTSTPIGENPSYALGEYDPAFAHRRVTTLYCGVPPSYEDVKAFAAASDQQAALDDALLACLDSQYWRHEGLHRLGDKRIRPLRAVGFDGIIPLADYSWDYRLFAYVLSDDRDMRQLLLADHHIDENGAVVTGTIAPTSTLFGSGGQPLAPERRAGMITTQWFLMIHTMFSELPRTTAAQAYRAYMGLDFSKSEGIWPVEGEPLDVDGKGVTAPVCAQCHSTLDPLSYAFSSYNGIGTKTDTFDFAKNGSFDPNRTAWSSDAVFLGEAVPDLTTLADHAANSDHFKQNLARMFFVHALGREPLPSEEEEFATMWRGIKDDEWSANRLIVRLVNSNAFGVP